MSEKSKGHTPVVETPQETEPTPAPETPTQQTTTTTTSSSSDSTIEDYGDFKPGTIVLAKLKSFPPWPAIVIPYDLVPEGVSKSKPKHLPQPRGSTKKSKNGNTSVASTPVKQDNRIWCVRFLRDDTYMWGGINDISLLTKPQIEKFLNDKKGKKLIKSAYEMALNPPDVEEFIIWGSNGKPITIDNEANDADFEDDGDGEDIGGGDDDGDELDDDEDEEVDESGSIDDDDDDEEIKTNKKRGKVGRPRGRPPSKKPKQTPTKGKPGRKPKATSTNGTPKGKPGRKPGRKKQVSIPEPTPEPETSSDEDWEQDNDETEPPVAINIPTSKELNDELKKRTPLVKRARITLQDFFLETKDLDTDSKTIKTINSTLESLEKYQDIQPSLIKHYNLHKVMFDILKRPDLEDSKNKDVKKFRKRIQSLVEIWFDVKIDVDENWDFVEKIEEVKQEKEGEAEDTNGNNPEAKLEENGKEKENGEVKDEDSETR